MFKHTNHCKDFPRLVVCKTIVYLFANCYGNTFYKIFFSTSLKNKKFLLLLTWCKARTETFSIYAAAEEATRKKSTEHNTHNQGPFPTTNSRQTKLLFPTKKFFKLCLSLT